MKLEFWNGQIVWTLQLHFRKLKRQTEAYLPSWNYIRTVVFKYALYKLFKGVGLYEVFEAIKKCLPNF